MHTKELAAFLLAQDPNAKVVLLSQFDQPIETQLLGPVVRSELATVAQRSTQTGPSDVLLVAGKRLRAGSSAAWRVAKDQARASQWDYLQQHAENDQRFREAIALVTSYNEPRFAPTVDGGCDELDCFGISNGEIKQLLQIAFSAGATFGRAQSKSM